MASTHFCNIETTFEFHCWSFCEIILISFVVAKSNLKLITLRIQVVADLYFSHTPTIMEEVQQEKWNNSSSHWTALLVFLLPRNGAMSVITLPVLATIPRHSHCFILPLASSLSTKPLGQYTAEFVSLIKLLRQTAALVMASGVSTEAFIVWLKIPHLAVEMPKVFSNSLCPWQTVIKYSLIF